MSDDKLKAVWEELLKPNSEDTEDEIDDCDLGSWHEPTPVPEEAYFDEDDDEEEEEWEYQQEFDEWENDMRSVNIDSDLSDVIGELNDIDSMVIISDHRYWPDTANEIEEKMHQIADLVSDLYSLAEDYRSDPRDW